MRLGIVTDVHNHAAELRNALNLFEREGVDQVVTIGDSCDAFAPPDGADEVAAMLASLGAVGVWGNHDFHLCRNVSDFCRERFAPATFEYMKNMQPYLEINDDRFSHMDASVDASDVMQLWGSGDGKRDHMAHAKASFAANRYPRQFMGHHHCWWAATPQGPLPWDGTEPLRFQPDERYVVIVAGVFQGKCAILDTTAACLEPHCCDAEKDGG